jgi:hypothetical protein
MPRINQTIASRELSFVRKLNSKHTATITIKFSIVTNPSRLFGTDYTVLAPTYTFATPVLGGQFAVGVTGIFRQIGGRH